MCAMLPTVFLVCTVHLVTQAMGPGPLLILLTMRSSHCVRCRATLPRSIVWTRVRITFVPHQVVCFTIGLAQLVAAAVTIVVRLLVIGTVEKVVVTVAAHLLVIAPSALTTAIVDFS
jgi:hypothetical protein